MWVILKMAQCTLIGYLSLYYYEWVDTSADGLFVPKGIINPVVYASSLTLLVYIFIIKIYIP
jgi:hypothetical protein